MTRYRVSQSILAQPIALWSLVLCAVAIVAAVVLDPVTELADRLALGATLAFIAGLAFARLVVTVDDEAVEARIMRVFHTRIPLTDIASVEARDYRPVRQFGGWGVRGGAHGSRAWTMAGSRAAVVTLTGGREVYLGAPDPDELARQIEAALLPLG